MNIAITHMSHDVRIPVFGVPDQVRHYNRSQKKRRLKVGM